MLVRDSRFIVGDIIRNISDSTDIKYILNVIHKQEVDENSRYNEEYEWYEYECYDLKNNTNITFRSYDDHKYDVIIHRFIFEDINPFMKVLVYNVMLNQWVGDIISSWGPWQIHTIGYGEFSYNEVIPYNDLTKHLINTSLGQTQYHNFSNIEEVIKFVNNNDLTNINKYKKL